MDILFKVKTAYNFYMEIRSLLLLQLSFISISDITFHCQAWIKFYNEYREDILWMLEIKEDVTCVEASTSQIPDQQMHVYELPSKILCRIMNVHLKAEPETDEVFAQVTLLPESNVSQEGICFKVVGVCLSVPRGL